MFVILSIYPWTKIDGSMSPFVAILMGSAFQALRMC